MKIVFINDIVYAYASGAPQLLAALSDTNGFLPVHWLRPVGQS